MALSGAEFKVKYPGPYYKFLRSDLTHKGFTYKLGLNVDTKKFNPSGECQEGGLYFFNDLKYFSNFYDYGPQLGIIDIPDDALVYSEEIKFKADKLFLSKIISSEDELLIFYKKVKENGYFFIENICLKAVQNGHLEVLKWARENGCPWNEKICLKAVQNGHLEVLKWARENGCPWDELTCTYAASYGHLEILKWARENGCPWNGNTYRSAFNPDILKWLEENECPQY